MVILGINGLTEIKEFSKMIKLTSLVKLNKNNTNSYASTITIWHFVAISNICAIDLESSCNIFRRLIFNSNQFYFLFQSIL